MNRPQSTTELSDSALDQASGGHQTAGHKFTLAALFDADGETSAAAPTLRKVGGGTILLSSGSATG